MIYYIMAIVVLLIALIIMVKFCGKYDKKNFLIFIISIIISMSLMTVGELKRENADEVLKGPQELQALYDGYYIWKEESGMVHYDSGNGIKKVRQEQIHIVEVDIFAHQIEKYGNKYVAIIPKGKLRTIN